MSYVSRPPRTGSRSMRLPPPQAIPLGKDASSPSADEEHQALAHTTEELVGRENALGDAQGVELHLDVRLFVGTLANHQPVAGDALPEAGERMLLFCPAVLQLHRYRRIVIEQLHVGVCCDARNRLEREGVVVPPSIDHEVRRDIPSAVGAAAGHLEVFRGIIRSVEEPVVVRIVG